MVSRRQIKHAIKVLTEACDEDFAGVKDELEKSLNIAKEVLSGTDKKINYVRDFKIGKR